MSQSNAVTQATATWYARPDRAGKRLILNELCPLNGWHRDHARKSLWLALRSRVIRPRAQPEPKYGM